MGAPPPWLFRVRHKHKDFRGKVLGPLGAKSPFHIGAVDVKSLQNFDVKVKMSHDAQLVGVKK